MTTQQKIELAERLLEEALELEARADARDARIEKMLAKEDEAKTAKKEAKAAKKLAKKIAKKLAETKANADAKAEADAKVIAELKAENKIVRKLAKKQAKKIAKLEAKASETTEVETKIVKKLDKDGISRPIGTFEIIQMLKDADYPTAEDEALVHKETHSFKEPNKKARKLLDARQIKIDGIRHALDRLDDEELADLDLELNELGESKKQLKKLYKLGLDEGYLSEISTFVADTLDMREALK